MKTSVYNLQSLGLLLRKVREENCSRLKPKLHFFLFGKRTYLRVTTSCCTQLPVTNLKKKKKKSHITALEWSLAGLVELHFAIKANKQTTKKAELTKKPPQAQKPNFNLQFKLSRNNSYFLMI